MERLFFFILEIDLSTKFERTVSRHRPHGSADEPRATAAPF
jgi:hypothetical protein